MQENYWGLDFGTTTTYLSSSSKFGDKLIRLGSKGEAFLPSISGFADDRLVFCEEAADLFEDYKIRSIKYMITRGLGEVPSAGVLESREVESGRVKLAPRLNTEDSQVIYVRSSVGEKQTSVESIISGILRKVQVEADLRNESAFGVRMGCPAMWDADRRKRLIGIAKSAGINVSDGTLIDEPIAAALNWIDENREESINGRVVIFDMGGGTLDVSVLHVEASPTSEPIIRVLSSTGVSEAGNDFDNSIADLIASTHLRDFDAAMISRNFGWIKELARTFKEALQHSESVVGTLLIPGFDPREVRLTRDDIREAIAEQMARAISRLELSIKSGLATAPDQKLKGSLSNSEWVEKLRKYEVGSVFGLIEYFVLAGGMVQMPLVQEFLISAGIDESKVSFADKANPAEAISKGLGRLEVPRRMSLHLPSFSFVLNFRDPQTGVETSLELYRAHTPLASWADVMQGNTSYYFQFKNVDLPLSGTGYISGKSVDGLDVKFSGDNLNNFGLRFAFGGMKDGVFKIARDGEIFIRDTSGRQSRYYIDGWPLVRNAETASVNVRTPRVENSQPSPWWSDYSNMRP
jgi:molecular chaperone DnaK (HSP70)